MKQELQRLEIELEKHDKVSDKICASITKLQQSLTFKKKIYYKLVELGKPVEERIENLKKEIGRQMRKDGASLSTISKYLELPLNSTTRMVTYGGANILTTTRRAAYKRDQKKCRICSTDSIRLELHHINESTNHNLRNLILLCHKCHRNADKIKRSDKKQYREFVKANF